MTGFDRIWRDHLAPSDHDDRAKMYLLRDNSPRGSLPSGVSPGKLSQNEYSIESEHDWVCRLGIHITLWIEQDLEKTEGGTSSTTTSVSPPQAFTRVTSSHEPVPNRKSISLTEYQLHNGALVGHPFSSLPHHQPQRAQYVPHAWRAARRSEDYARPSVAR